MTAFGSSGDLREPKVTSTREESEFRESFAGLANRWPDQPEPVNGTDWLPTFSAVAHDVPTDKPVDGANLLPAFVGNGEVNREIPMMWWLWHARGGYEVAMRQGNYKILATMLFSRNRAISTMPCNPMAGAL